MQLLEFQAKELFREYGINLLDSISSTNIEEGRKHAKELGYPFVIKIQVPVGGRGKAGGIQKCQNDDEFDIKYPQVMDLEIKGEKARAILLEKMADIKKELYLSIFLNRSKRCYTIIASAEGGVEIESVKNQIIKEVGLGEVSDELAREVAKKHSIKVWVRQSARGSIKHTTAIYGDSKTTGTRIELHEALLARGYESHTLDLESHYLRLAREHEHTRLDVLIMKRAQ